MLRASFHLTAALINTYSLWYDQTYVDLPLPKKELQELPLRSRCMFLTMWDLALQTIYFYIAFSNDVFGSQAKGPKNMPFIRKVKDTLFSLAFPLAIYVSVAFWGIYAVDKDLIFPDHIEKLYPVWLNHVMHTTVAVFILIEMMTSYRCYPTRKVGVSIILIFNMTYTIWMFYLYSWTEVWVYPIFDHLNWPLRVVFVGGSLFIGYVFYVFGEKLNSVFCSNKNYYANGKVKGR